MIELFTQRAARLECFFTVCTTFQSAKALLRHITASLRTLSHGRGLQRDTLLTCACTLPRMLFLMLALGYY